MIADGPTVEHGAAIISRELARGDEWMSQAAVTELLSCHGIAEVASRLVDDAEHAVLAAQELGMPVALKGLATGLLHKRDVGAVAVGLQTTEAVLKAAEQIRSSVNAAGDELEGYLVQPVVADGVELLVGVVQDQSFGPVLACGSGGTTAELMRDVAVRITPVSDLDAQESCGR